MANFMMSDFTGDSRYKQNKDENKNRSPSIGTSIENEVPTSHNIPNNKVTGADKTIQSPRTNATYTVNAGNQPYVNQLNSLYDQIMNRKPFQYDLNGDLLYRQMADQYTQLGQQAMRDATGTAAGLTGGYGNSYAAQVGNQAYQQYLTALNQNIPELWDRAYQAYLNHGDQLLQQYKLAAEHPEYLDALSPKTYTMTSGSDDADADDSYLQALINSGLVPGVAGAVTGAAGVAGAGNNTYDYNDYLKRVMELQK